jgi:hypothetical protein
MSSDVDGLLTNDELLRIPSGTLLQAISELNKMQSMVLGVCCENDPRFGYDLNIR